MVEVGLEVSECIGKDPNKLQILGDKENRRCHNCGVPGHLVAYCRGQLLI